jgi:hypothetical protein
MIAAKPLLLIFALLAANVNLHATDWPHWRGPNQ